MGNQEDYKKKPQAISTIEDSQIKTPHHIPVGVYIQEADALYHWAQADKEALTAVGLSCGLNVWRLSTSLFLQIYFDPVIFNIVHYNLSYKFSKPNI